MIKLKGGGFIIEDSFNELDYLRSKYAEAVNNKNYFLVILPTLNCNYSCWYCIQTHIPSKMSLETISAIKEHIKNMVEVEKIDSLHLDWFGGEPFLYFSQVIQPISEYAMEICHRNNTPFLNSATTNGFFLKREIHETLGKLCFKQFQITLDGNREFHDKVKFTKSCDSTFVHPIITTSKYSLRHLKTKLACHASIYHYVWETVHATILLVVRDVNMTA